MAPEGASLEAAVGAAKRIALLELAPARRATIDSIFNVAAAKIPDGPWEIVGIAKGEYAARAVIALKTDDGHAAVEPAVVQAESLLLLRSVFVSRQTRRSWSAFS